MATKDQNEAEIRWIIERWIDALRAKDLDRLMASYETDVVAFDAATPLRYIGVDAYRKSWGDFFDTIEGPIDFELRDLSIVADESVAFAHGLCHTTAQRKNGPRGDVWMRWTAGWKKLGGSWLLVHEHLSAPFDQRSRAVLHATP